MKNTGIDIPVTHNGLGYNNLIYTALVLADIETRNKEHFSENAKAFNILVMEEPEAHLRNEIPLLLYLAERFIIKNGKIIRSAPGRSLCGKSPAAWAIHT